MGAVGLFTGGAREERDFEEEAAAGRRSYHCVNSYSTDRLIEFAAEADYGFLPLLDRLNRQANLFYDGHITRRYNTTNPMHGQDSWKWSWKIIHM